MSTSRPILEQQSMIIIVVRILNLCSTSGPTANGGPGLPRAKPTSFPKPLSAFQWTLLPSLPASSKVIFMIIMGCWVMGYGLLQNQPNNADHLLRVPGRYEAVQGLANMRCQKPGKENVNDNCTSASKEKANNNKRDNIARDEIRNKRDADSAPWRG